jgi:hypothetical protein
MLTNMQPREELRFASLINWSYKTKVCEFGHVNGKRKLNTLQKIRCHRDQVFIFGRNIPTFFNAERRSFTKNYVRGLLPNDRWRKLDGFKRHFHFPQKIGTEKNSKRERPNLFCLISSKANFQLPFRSRPKSAAKESLEVFTRNRFLPIIKQIATWKSRFASFLDVSDHPTT